MIWLLNFPGHSPIEAAVAAVDDVHSLVEQQPDFAAHFLVGHTVGEERTGVRVSVEPAPLRLNPAKSGTKESIHQEEGCGSRQLK